MFSMYLIKLILDFAMWHNISVALFDCGRADEAQEHGQDEARVGDGESHQNNVRFQIVLADKFEVATEKRQEADARRDCTVQCRCKHTAECFAYTTACTI